MRACERCLGLEEAITILEELKANTEAEEWVLLQVRRAILTGVRMSVQRLQNEITECRHH
jgi:hypothetical protein